MIAEDTLWAESSESQAGETLVDIATRRAQVQGTSPAFTYLADGVQETHRLSYSELDASAREIAAGLLSMAKPGDRVLLVYESGLDFVRAFFGALYAGLIAVPIPAPAASHMKATPQRVKAVVADCQAALLLGNASSHALLRSCGLDAFLEGDIPWIDTQQFTGGPKLMTVEPPAPETLAYLQYTSGSTSTPKGVMITHANLVRHLTRMRQGLEYDANSVSVSWMPHFHDYGLIEGILMPVFNGTPVYLMSAFAFLKLPITWLEAISTYRGTHTQGPNFAYRYCVRRIRPDQCGALDLSSLRASGNAAEPIHPTTSEEFYSKFAPFGLRWEALCPAYGLAEATLLVTTTPMDASPSVGRFDSEALSQGEVILLSDARSEGQSVSCCGRPLPATEVAIVDPDTKQRMSPGKVGEVWVRSEGVAAGYWGRPDESAQTFRAEIAGEAGRTYLRTGDLGFLHAGQLYITARAKDLIILHGLNHHPQDVEWTVQQAHPALRADHGAAFGIDVNGEERLAVVQELERAEYSSEELLQIVQAMVQSVADYHGATLHTIALIKRGSLPKTSSGKIQRHAARDSFLTGSLKSLLEWPAGQAVISSAKVISESIAPLGNMIKMHSHNSIGDERGERSARSRAPICRAGPSPI